MAKTKAAKKKSTKRKVVNKPKDHRTELRIKKPLTKEQRKAALDDFLAANSVYRGFEDTLPKYFGLESSYVDDAANAYEYFTEDVEGDHDLPREVAFLVVLELSRLSEAGKLKHHETGKKLVLPPSYMHDLPYEKEAFFHAIACVDERQIDDLIADARELTDEYGYC